MSLIFNDITEDMLQDVHVGRIFFKANDRFQEYVKEWEERQGGDLLLNTVLLNTEHKGRGYNVYIKNEMEHDIGIKRRLNFLSAVWTKEELVGGTANLSKLANRQLMATAAPLREYNGKTYQDLNNWVDKGVATPDVIPF